MGSTEAIWNNNIWLQNENDREDPFLASENSSMEEKYTAVATEMRSDDQKTRLRKEVTIGEQQQ